MATYLTLRDRALKQCSATGEAETEDVAEIALEECMKFVAFHVRVPSLVASATATAGVDPDLEANAITLSAGGFNISSTFRVPDRLFVKADNTVVDKGAPYEFLEYDTALDLLYSPNRNRQFSFDDELYGDQTPDRWYTITPDNKVWARPLQENNVLTLFYRKEPAVYADGTTPEINSMFDWILVKGAVLAIKEYQREPDRILSMWDLFTNGLKDDIDTYDSFINGRRKRDEIKIHKSYRP